MQFGQVPIQYVPDAVINDTRALTMAPRGTEALAPAAGTRGGEPVPIGVRPGEAAPVPLSAPSAPGLNWAVVGGVFLFLWMVARRG